MTEDAGKHASRGRSAPGSELDAEPFGSDWRGVLKRRGLVAWLTAFVVLGIALYSMLILRTDGSPERTSLLGAQAPTFKIEMPGTGRDLLLSVAQLRWCLREDMRIETFEQRLSYSEPKRFASWSPTTTAAARASGTAIAISSWRAATSTARESGSSRKRSQKRIRRPCRERPQGLRRAATRY